MYHGIILDQEFEDPKYPEIFKIFAKRKSFDNDWILYGIEIDDSQLKEVILNLQRNIKNSKPYYAHLYNDNELIVIFKDKVFNVSAHISSWKDLVDYGKTLNIPKEQLDFWPNRFQDERHYFKPEDFI